MGSLYEKVMGQPTITRSVTTEAASGDNEVVAAPSAGYKNVVLYYQVQNESATATTVLIKHGSTTIARAVLDQYDAYVRDLFAYPLELTGAFTVNLDGANSHGVVVEYATVKA